MKSHHQKSEQRWLKWIEKKKKNMGKEFFFSLNEKKN